MPHAEEFADRAVDARKKALGTEDEKYLESLYTQATVLSQSGQRVKALDVFDQARQGYHKIRDVAEEAHMLQMAAAELGSSGNLNEENKRIDDALALLDTIPRDNNYPLLLEITLLSRIEKEVENGALDKAQADLSKMMSAIKGHFGPSHSATLGALTAAIDVSLAKGDVDGAIAYGNQSLAGLGTRFKGQSSGSGDERSFDDADFDAVFRAASTAKGRETFSVDRTLQVVQ